MTFNEGMQFDPNRASTGGGGGRGRGLAIGGGAGGLVLIVLGLLTGQLRPEDLGSLLGQSTGGDSSASGAGPDISQCTTAEAANTDVNCRIIATMTSLDSVWNVLLPEQAGMAYQQPGLKLFEGQVGTGCGAATSDVGPFYCPADNVAYFDSDFFKVLQDRFGSSDGPLAQEYVVAHEVGHHIQTMLGDIQNSQQDPKGAESGAVRTELQADCYGGVWAHWADKTPAPGSDKPFLAPISRAQIQDAVSAAESVGDDRIQEAATGSVNPNTFTHGRSKQRVAWFLKGYGSGQMGDCDTYNARDLDRP